MRYMKVQTPNEPSFEIVPALDKDGNPISKLLIKNASPEAVQEILDYFGGCAKLTEVKLCDIPIIASGNSKK